MRLIHRVPFSPSEIESYRQLVFNNLTHGMKYLIDSMEDMGISLSEEYGDYVQLIDDATDLRDGQPFPPEFLEPLRKLWEDQAVQKAWERGNEAALPEKFVLHYLHISVALAKIIAKLLLVVLLTTSRIWIGYSTLITSLMSKISYMQEPGRSASQRLCSIFVITRC